jgi:hypothetical protein
MAEVGEGGDGAVSEALVLPERVVEITQEDRVKVAVYAAEPSTQLAPRLVQAERMLLEMRETLMAMLIKEDSELAEARQDRETLATKLGRVLKDSTSRSNHEQTLVELRDARRESARLKRENPLTQENLELRRKIAELELRVAGRIEEADSRLVMNAEVAAIERAEQRRPIYDETYLRGEDDA